jgi:myosin heavy subunit
MDTQELLNKIEKLKKAIQAESDPDVKASFGKKLAQLEAQVAQAQAAVEKKEEKVATDEKKNVSEIEEKIKKLEKAIANESDVDVKKSFEKKLKTLKESLSGVKEEIKEEKKEIAEQKKDVKAATKEVQKVIKQVEVAEKKEEKKNISDAEEKIKKLEKAIANESDEDVKKNFEKKLKQLKESLSDVKKDSKEAAKEVKKPVVRQAKPQKVVRKIPIKKAAPAPTPSPRRKKLKGVLAELDALIEKNRRLKAKYGTSYKGTGKPSDLERDSKRKAKPFGYRFVGKHNYRVPTEMEIKKGLKRGTIDYEARPNRADISVKRKVKLEDGGKADVHPEWLVMIKSEEGNIHEWKGFAKSEDEALHKAEQEAGFESIESGINMLTDENGKVIEYKKGGKTKEKWIQDALAGRKGVLRSTAKKKGLLRGDENLSKTDLKKLQKMGGKTAKRAHLAETLSKFKKGGKVGYSDEDKARFAKPAGWRWKEEAFKKGFITRTQLAQKPSKYMREKYPTMVYYEDRLNKSDKKPTRTSAPSV